MQFSDDETALLVRTHRTVRVPQSGDEVDLANA